MPRTSLAGSEEVVMWEADGYRGQCPAVRANMHPKTGFRQGEGVPTTRRTKQKKAAFLVGQKRASKWGSLQNRQRHEGDGLERCPPKQAEYLYENWGVTGPGRQLPRFTSASINQSIIHPSNTRVAHCPSHRSLHYFKISHPFLARKAATFSCASPSMQRHKLECDPTSSGTAC